MEGLLVAGLPVEEFLEEGHLVVGVEELLEEGHLVEELLEAEFPGGELVARDLVV